MKKNIALVLLTIITLSLGGYIIYDKVLVSKNYIEEKNIVEQQKAANEKKEDSHPCEEKSLTNIEVKEKTLSGTYSGKVAISQNAETKAYVYGTIKITLKDDNT